MDKVRKSNLELFRIITMLAIVAHHYVVCSDLWDTINLNGAMSIKNIFLLLFGAWGKTGINCFVLITGYFMCTANIKASKFLKLVMEIYFYNIVISFLLLITGNSILSFRKIYEIFFPFNSIETNFVGCYLIFYLFIPYLNKLIKVMNEKEHRILLILLLMVYTIFPSILYSSVKFNYTTWFMVVYLLASYIRLYPKTWFQSKKIWGIISFFSILLSVISIIIMFYLDRDRYFYVADCNKIFALTTSVGVFMFFKNLNIKNSVFINTISASTFGVLLIHANSMDMHHWLWDSVLKNALYYDSKFIYVHAIGSVMIGFAVCSVIDIIRIRFIEKPFLHQLEKYGWYQKILLLDLHKGRKT